MINNETIECWRSNYELSLDPDDLSEFWRGYTPTGAVLALKAAVEEIERLQAQLAEARDLLSDDALDPPTHQPSMSWYERRADLLDALLGEESE